MHGRGDRILVLLAVLISIALSAITISAVMRQSDTLREREAVALRETATRAAQDRSSALRADLNRLFTRAGEVLQEGGRDGLDAWLAHQPQWPMFLVELSANHWAPMPMSPTQTPPEFPQSDELAAAEDMEFIEQDLSAAQEQIEQFADRTNDPRLKIRARLAAAGVQRKRGFPQAAARTFRETLALLEPQPSLVRVVFWVKLSIIECWLTAGQFALARDALTELLTGMREDHPARYSSADIALVRSRLTWLRARSPVNPADDAARAADERLDEMLRELQLRADRRDQFAALLVDVRRALLKRPEAGSGATIFMGARTESQLAMVIAVRGVSDDVRVAVAIPARELIEHYWNSDGQAEPWHIALPGEMPVLDPICSLGEPFGNAQLVPTLETIAKFADDASQRIILLLGVTVGTTLAWGVVLLMLARAVRRQRELALLQRRFVADVSHELKTPLALIRLLTETLLDGRVTDPARVRHYLTTIGREGERLTNLLDSILDFSRIESGRKQYNFADCDVGQAARRAWTLFEPQFQADGFAMRLEIADPLPVIHADGEALQQLIVNLLQNAHRYAGEGKFVRLAIEPDGAGIRIRVEDHGIGMTRAQLRRVGDSFYRAEDPRVRQTRGAGLGLAIVRHIVAAHRGVVDIQSRPGRGTVFSVRLPAGARSEAPRFMEPTENE